MTVQTFKNFYITWKIFDVPPCKFCLNYDGIPFKVDDFILARVAKLKVEH